jgi:diguanylate cyclase (GGDEF)-like protein/PAS domain S-box-containing protein
LVFFSKETEIQIGMRTRHWLSQKLALIIGFALIITAPFAAYRYDLAAAVLFGVLAVLCFVIHRFFFSSGNSHEEQFALSDGVFSEPQYEQFEPGPTLQVLQKSEKEFRNAFEFAAIGMAIVSPENEFLRVNRSVSEIFGRTTENLLDTGLLSLVVPEDADSVKLNLANLLGGIVQSFQSDTRFLRKNGETVWLRLSASLIVVEQPHFILQFEDITDRKNTEDRLLHNALYDVLTDLPNRFLFIDRLQVAVNRVRRDPNVRLTVLHVDFDRFKLINDRFGQHLADRMLVQASQRLRKILRATNTVARLGADEFAIFVEDGSFEEILSIVGRIRQELSRPFDLEGDVIYATVSVGIAIGSPTYESPEFLLRDADTALKQAKRLGRDRYEIFSDEMHSRSIDFLQMETDLRHALERGEFRLFYQPIVTLETGILAGFESLVRWDHPTRGFISPAEFIPIAEDTGLIIPIGEWVLRESCHQLRSWQMISDRSADLWVSVNVSSKQFVQFDLVTLVASALEETGLKPRCLKLEITESTMVENIEYVASVMEKLKQTGVKLSIDDFGTGFSSLSILHRFPLDSLKIDRSFVSQIKDAETPVEIVKTIVNLSNSLGLEIIAEGVETIEQLSQLRQLGCKYGQGYCFATPLAADTVEELLGLSPSSSAFYYLLPASSLASQPIMH